MFRKMLISRALGIIRLFERYPHERKLAHLLHKIRECITRNEIGKPYSLSRRKIKRATLVVRAVFNRRARAFCFLFPYFLLNFFFPPAGLLLNGASSIRVFSLISRAYISRDLARDRHLSNYESRRDRLKFGIYDLWLTWEPRDEPRNVCVYN